MMFGSRNCALQDNPFARKGEARPAMPADAPARPAFQPDPDSGSDAPKSIGGVRNGGALARMIRRSGSTPPLPSLVPAMAERKERPEAVARTHVDLRLLTRTEDRTSEEIPQPAIPRRKLTLRLGLPEFRALEAIRKEGGSTYQSLLETAVRDLIARTRGKT